MMDFDTMKKTCEQLTKEEHHRPELYRIKVGNDIIEVFSNFRYIQFPEELEVSVHRHYIGRPDNLPSNPRRTTALQSAVKDYFDKRLLKEMEDEVKEIAKWPSVTELQETYCGRHFHFIKGATANDVLKQMFAEYSAYQYHTIFGKPFFEILVELNKELDDGFLHEAIKEELSWFEFIDNLQ